VNKEHEIGANDGNESSEHEDGKKYGKDYHAAGKDEAKQKRGGKVDDVVVSPDATEAAGNVKVGDDGGRTLEEIVWGGVDEINDE